MRASIDFPKLIKYIYDLKKNIKLIVSGTSSLEIRAKISESLTGRKQLFYRRPFEAKFTAMKAPVLTRSFNSFLSTYQPKLGVVFTKDYLGHTQVNQAEVLFLPAWALLFLKLEHLLKT
jgi:hypothetical protein